MSEIKRYDNTNGGSIACHECYMDESNDGDYVRHTDHVAYLNEAKIELRAAQSGLSALREEVKSLSVRLVDRDSLIDHIGSMIAKATSPNQKPTESGASE